ncbi:MAG: phage holin family protein, partial [Planctomycetes bacterium]|nr:phage holin family protein [Planctomycetota bacterium]
MNSAHAETSASWSGRTRRLASELLRMVQLRRELAELEIRHDYRTLRRLAVVGGSGALLVVVGLPLLFVALAHGLANVTTLGVVSWLVILASTLMVPGATILMLAIRRFRAEFSGLRATRAELQEDLIWLREWHRPPDATSD